MDGYTEFITALGRRIKESRKEAGMSQRALARAVGTSQGAISQYENGRYVMSIWMLMKLCEVLGASADELLGLEDE